MTGNAKVSPEQALEAIRTELEKYIIGEADEAATFAVCRRLAAALDLHGIEEAITQAKIRRMGRPREPGREPGRELVVVKPQLPGAPDDVVDLEIAALNEHHAVISNAGGKTVIARWGLADPSDPNSRTQITYQGVQDFKLQYCNRHADVPLSTRNGTTIVEQVELGSYWIKHRQRRQYLGIVFIPEAEERINDYLNLWRGWGVGPVALARWELIRQHIYEVICGCNDEYYWYVISWIAWALQNPGKLAEVALVLIGEKGAGKGTLARVLQIIFGDHAYAVSSPEDVYGKFNHHLQDCLLLIADEMYWTGSAKGREAAGRLQNMITEPKISVEPKGMDRYQAINRLKILMLAEPKWVIPAGRHERRYAALDVSHHRLRDKAYFRALHAEIEGDGPAAMFAELRAMDLGDWHPRDIPDALLRSPAMRKQQAMTLPPEEQWYLSILHEGRLPANLKRNRPDCCPTKALTQSAKDFHNRLRYTANDTSICSFLMDKERIGVECVKARDRAANGRQFPPLAECRAALDTLYGPFAWENPVTEWQSAWTAPTPPTPLIDLMKKWVV